MIFGYGRVSTRDQNLFLQEDALNRAGCEQIFMEKITGSKKSRPELDRLLATIREGDTVVVWKLSRWGRSNQDLIELMNKLLAKKVAFQCLSNSMDTRTPEGRMVYGIFSALAEFERETIVENTNAGLTAARARGRVGGRKPGLSKEADIKASAAKTLYESGNTVQKICTMLGIGSKRTLYKYLREKGVKIGEQESS